MPEDSRSGRLFIVATQHLDVAWLWKRHPEGEELMKRCFERAIEMIEGYPEVKFIFSRSTAWSFQAMERNYPELFSKIRKHVGLGKIEVCGGQWVEPDNIIPDGESLVRQSLYGQRYFRDTFGKCATVCWNPDAFSHGDSLPQILRKSGLEGYYFHRCQPFDSSGEVINKFIWEGFEGTRVFVLAGKWRGKPDSSVLAECIPEMERTGLPVDYVVTGANSDRRVTMERDWIPLLEEGKKEQSLPDCGWASSDEVLNQLKLYADRLPIIKGELGFEYTGTYTSDSRIKRLNRYAEVLLTDAEKLSSWAILLGLEYPQELLREAWCDLCVNQFHDIICGTCYEHVQEEAYDLFSEIIQRGSEVRRKALQFLAEQLNTHTPKDGEPFVVFNTLSWDRTAHVTLAHPSKYLLRYDSFRMDPLPPGKEERGRY